MPAGQVCWTIKPIDHVRALCSPTRPGARKPGTQWLLHYHLSAPHHPTAFWHFLVTRRFVPGNTFTAEDLVNDLTSFLRQEAGKDPAARSVRSAVTIFIGSYLKSDGLNRLGSARRARARCLLCP